MPHLTIPGGALQAPVGTAGRTGLGVPGWAHPMLAPAEWAALARPGLPLHWTVLDVAGGPGARPDPYCLASAARLHEAGAGVLGHLDMREGARSFGELVSDAHRYLDWYRVDGFYLARCPTGYAQLAETRRTATTLRALCAQQRRHRDRHARDACAQREQRPPHGGPVQETPRAGGADGVGSGGSVTALPVGRPGASAALVFAHGRHPHPGYAELADQLVTFSGGWTDYRWSEAAEWTADHPPERFCHLVHGIPRMHIDEALRIARWQGAATVFFTDRSSRRGGNPWETLPGFWDEVVSRLGPGVSE